MEHPREVSAARVDEAPPAQAAAEELAPGSARAHETSQAPNSVVNKIPLGFRQASEFESFGGSLYGGLESAGFKNVEAAFQGSSVTGRAL